MSTQDTNYVLEKKHRAMWQNFRSLLWIKDSSFKIGFLFKNEALLEGAQASATSAAARQGYFILVVLDPFAKMKRKKGENATKSLKLLSREQERKKLSEHLCN